LLVSLFAPVFVFATIALAMGVRKFWRDIAPAGIASPQPGAAREATVNVLALTYLAGGHGEGCNNDSDAYTLARQRAHHLTFYGFMLCFAATSVATVYHYVFGWLAPYDLPSLPKVLGAAGGISLLVGTGGLLWLNLKRDPKQGDPAQKPMDLGFIALLLATSVTGLALWLARATPALPALLAVHLGVVMALFATLPYGKFAHGVFRTAALLKFAIEKRQPNRLALTD
jgi:citrate/tricarballylate utilization protein